MNQLLMQMGMEAFSNPQVIDNSIRFLNDNKLFTNEFLNDFKLVNLWPLTSTNSLGALSGILNPSTDGRRFREPTYIPIRLHITL